MYNSLQCEYTNSTNSGDFHYAIGYYPEKSTSRESIETRKTSTSIADNKIPNHLIDPITATAVAVSTVTTKTKATVSSLKVNNAEKIAGFDQQYVEEDLELTRTLPLKRSHQSINQQSTFQSSTHDRKRSRPASNFELSSNAESMSCVMNYTSKSEASSVENTEEEDEVNAISIICNRRYWVRQVELAKEFLDRIHQASITFEPCCHPKCNYDDTKPENSLVQKLDHSLEGGIILMRFGVPRSFKYPEWCK